MKRYLSLALALIVAGSLLPTPARATITCSVPNVFATQAGPNIPLSQLDTNFSTVNGCYSGLVAALTDLPLAVNATGTRAWAKGADIADAASIALGSDGNYFVVNGTTTVTAISTKQAGTVILLRFSGARTLTHNATTLILMGATNATTANGDLYWFISEGGGNWREIWRRPVTSADVSHVFSGAGTFIAQAAYPTRAWSADLGPTGTGARTSATTYTNSSGHEMLVVITMKASGAANVTSDLLVGGVTINPLNITGAGVAVDRIAHTLEVPNGATYRLNITNGAIQTWFELS